VKPIKKIIFGLGNPGAGYKHNRHNIGYKVLDRLSEVRSGVSFRRKLRIDALVTKLDIEGDDVLLIKPVTFMNNSGVCVKKTLGGYGVTPDNILIVYDDIDLPLGTIRFREKGSAGSHRGIDSIIDVLREKNISRIRVGIGNVGRAGDLSDYVLSNFTRDELGQVASVVAKAADACIDWVKFDNNYVMRNYNRKQSED